MDDGGLQDEFRETLNEITRTRIPFGKYGPKHFPPSGVPIYDLPWEYLDWFRQRGFPKSRLGELLEIMYHLKSDGSDHVFDIFRRQEGGRHSLRKPKTRNSRFPSAEHEE